MLLTPSMIEEAAENIVNFWSISDLPASDKAKILEMVKDFYADKNETLVDQYLAGLTERTIIRNTAETGFESDV